MKRLLLTAAIASVMCAGASAQITSQPAGTATDLVGNSRETFLIYNGMLGRSANGGYQACVVVDGNDIYVKGVVSQYEATADVWIKGTLDDKGNASFPMPQTAVASPDPARTVEFNMLTINADKSLIPLPGEDNVLKMTWDGSSLRQVVPELPETDPAANYIGFIGLTRNGSFIGYGDRNIVYNHIPDLVQPTDAAVITPYTIIGTNAWNESQSGTITVARDLDKIWIKGLYPVAADVWIEGTVADGKATFPSAQYLGLSTLGYYSFFYGAQQAPNKEYTWETAATFTLDDDRLVADNPFMFNFGNEFYQLSYGYYTATLEAASTEMPVPSAPYDISAMTEDGIGFIEFYLDAKDAEGRPIDSSKLYYNIFIDGELLVLTPDTYGTETDITDIPYQYNDDEMIGATDSYHIVIIFSEPQSVAVRAVYKDGDQVSYSDTVMGIGSISAAPGADTPTYYNLQGVKVDSPSTAGIYLRRAGNRTTKVIVK